MIFQENSKTYDVIIIGAGPAGLRAAKVLADAGKRVLLLEKQSVPCNKICAEGVTAKTLRLSYFPTLCITKKFNQIKLVFHGKRTIWLKEETPLTCSIDRGKLGKALANQAINAGAQIIYNKRAVGIEKSKNNILVKTSTEIFRSIYLLGAEGFSSVTRKYLNLPEEKCGFALDYLIPGNFKNMEFHINPKLFGPFYGWVFPHEIFASVGTGCSRDMFTPQKIKESLVQLCIQQKLDVTKAKKRSAGLGVDYRGWNFGNIFLAGEAAGLVQNLTGEGIYNALVSGDEIARYILDPKIKTPGIDDMIESKSDQQKLLDFHHFSPILLSLLYLIVPFLLKFPRFRKRVHKAMFH